MNGWDQHKCRKGSLRHALSGVIYALLLCAVFAMTGCRVVEIFPTAQPTEKIEGEKPFARITFPKFEEEVWLCSDLGKPGYAETAGWKAVSGIGSPYRAFCFPYQLQNTTAVLYISEDEALVQAQKYSLEQHAPCIYIHNLKVNTTYYYKVVLAQGEEYTGHFRTANSNRFVYIPGLINTRDIGGYVNLDGKTVKQGLLIRGVELDGLVVEIYFIPEEELEYVKNCFGFVYDMDLRSATVCEGDYSSRFCIAHAFYDAPQYEQIFSEAYRESLRRIFSDLADPEKYPMYLHCTWGMDRTGTIIYLLQGVLNLSQEDMVREYMLSSYTAGHLLEINHIDAINSGMMDYEGDTLQEKIVTYLTSVVGVTEEEIASIRHIFLE